MFHTGLGIIMSTDYQKGRYDELVERHKELLEMYRNLEWQAFVNVPRSGISGAMVHYYSGVKFDSRAIGLTIGGTGIAFSILAFLYGLIPVTVGITLAVFGVLFGLTSYLKKETAETSQALQTPMPQQHA
jgi:hypothetical protein